MDEEIVRRSIEESFWLNPIGAVRYYRKNVVVGEPKLDAYFGKRGAKKYVDCNGKFISEKKALDVLLGDRDYIERMKHSLNMIDLRELSV